MQKSSLKGSEMKRILVSCLLMMAFVAPARADVYWKCVEYEITATNAASASIIYEFKNQSSPLRVSIRVTDNGGASPVHVDVLWYGPETTSVNERARSSAGTLGSEGSVAFPFAIQDPGPWQGVQFIPQVGTCTTTCKAKVFACGVRGS